MATLGGNVDARVVDQSRGHTYIAKDGGSINISVGANIVMSSSTRVMMELPPLPLCPAPCAGYIRRESIEELLVSYFLGPGHDKSQMKRFVLHGLGGSGKTQAALNFIYKFFYEASPEERRFSEAYWIDATSIETIIKSLEDIALSAGVGSKAEDALRLLASRNAKSNWIMLFNNADDPALDLTPYFPKCTHGSIIITTRNRQATRYGLGSGSDLGVSGMEHDEARELFVNEARLFGPDPAALQVIDELIQELEYFPLSVRQAGAYIHSALSTPQEYLVMFRTRRKQLLRKLDEMKNPDDYQYASVQATLAISYNRLSPNGKRVLEFFAFLHHEHIETKIFQDMCSHLSSYRRNYKRLLTKDEKAAIAALRAFRELLISDGYWDIQKLRKHIEDLLRYSFISYSPDRATCSIHPLVQDWIRTFHSKAKQLAIRHMSAVLLGCSIFAHGNNTAHELAFKRSLIPHVDTVMQDGEVPLNGCRNEFGDVYSAVGNFEQQSCLFGKFADACMRILGERHRKTLTSMNNLANAHHDQGKFDQALELHARTLELRRTTLGDEDPATLISMNNLGRVYFSQGKFEQAVETFSTGLEIRKRVLGEEHYDTLASMNNLAATYREQGIFNQAGELHAQTLEILKRTIGDNHPDTLSSMNNLALSYYDQGRFDKAAELYSRALEIIDESKTLPSTHPTSLLIMNNLAEAYNSLGQFDKAVEIHKKTLEIRREVLGSNHPETLGSLHNLASAYRSQGKFKQAVELSSQALDVQKTMLGVDHPDTLTSMNNLGLTYYSLGMYDKAAELHSEALETRKNLLGVDHPSTLTSMNNLASAYQHIEGKLDKSAKLHLLTLEGRRRLLGADHPRTLMSMNNLAETYHSQGELGKAVELHSQALELRKTALGTNHPDVLMSMSNLAETYRDQGNLDKAIELHFQALELRKASLGSNHPDTLVSMNNLALVYQGQGNLSKAIELQLEALGGMKEVLGPNHPNTLALMNNLSETYRQQGDFSNAVERHSQVLEALKGRFGVTHPHTLSSMNNLALSYEGLGSLDQASELYSQILLLGTEKLGSNHYLIRQASSRKQRIASQQTGDHIGDQVSSSLIKPPDTNASPDQDEPKQVVQSLPVPGAESDAHGPMPLTQPKLDAKFAYNLSWFWGVALIVLLLACGWLAVGRSE